MDAREIIKTTIEQVTPELIELRRDIHMHPEVSWQEFRTTDIVAAWLDKHGWDHRRFEPTGVTADLGPGGGPVVALRADLDALPVPDMTQDPWHSVNEGVAHACGHDVHVAALLGAAAALAEVERQIGLPHRVRLVFQPAEEVMPGGALKFLTDGALSGVSRIFALHCDPALDVGSIGIREGAITGASDHLRITLSGRGGHTSRPHVTEDLVHSLGVIVTGLPAVLSRRFDPRAGVSVVWGQVHAGHAANVIPASGELQGTVRMLEASAWHEAEHIVRAVVADLVKPYGVTAEVNYTRGVPPVVNEFGATERFRTAVTSALGPQALAVTQQSLGGEDFAWYVETMPGAMARLGTRTPGGPTHDLHQGNFRVDERAIGVGALTLANAALV